MSMYSTSNSAYGGKYNSSLQSTIIKTAISSKRFLNPPEGL